ncbi:MAG: DUF177 domain-containing protein [Alphaproteobacteria bacterium]|nr:DUF177 domain-containing protein [Alphaproteobacteria bacterium]
MKDKKTPLLQTEWFRPVDVARVTEEAPLKVAMTATQAECRDLARRFSVEKIQDVSADMSLIRESGALIRVTGFVEALVIQECVVTREPIENRIVESFESWYADEETAVSLSRARHERLSRIPDAEIPILEEKDDPEPVVDGKIDLGELAAQYLALAIDPYPHKAGIVYENGDDSKAARVLSAAERPHPFAGLKEWKKNKEESH